MIYCFDERRFPGSNDDSAELVVTAPPSFALKTKPTKVTVREMLMGARKSILITGYSLSDYFAELVDCVIQKSQEGVLVKFFVNDIESQKAFDRLCCYKGKFLRIYNYPKQEDKMSALHVTGTVRYKAPYDEKVHDGSLY